MDLLCRLLLGEAEEEDQRPRAEGKGIRISIQFAVNISDSASLTVPFENTEECQRLECVWRWVCLIGKS